MFVNSNKFIIPPPPPPPPKSTAPNRQSSTNPFDVDVRVGGVSVYASSQPITPAVQKVSVKNEIPPHQTTIITTTITTKIEPVPLKNESASIKKEGPPKSFQTKAVERTERSERTELLTTKTQRNEQSNVVRTERNEQSNTTLPIEQKTDFHQARENVKKLFETPPPVFTPAEKTTPKPKVSLQKATEATPLSPQSPQGPPTIEITPYISAVEFPPPPPPIFNPDRKSVSLLKGHHLSLSQQVPRLRRIMIGLGWDVSRKHNKQFDLDASVFLLQENGKVRSARDLIYYNNLRSTCGAVAHNGDNRTGIGEFDDETIVVDLTMLPREITKLIFAVSIHDAEKRKQNFGMVDRSFIRVVDLECNMEICRYDLKHEVSKFFGMICGEIYQCNNEWRFRAIGQGFDGGIKSIAEFFGVILVDRDAQGSHRFFC
eukprot:TRINITY_DN1675_c0_g1_i11.p1 TRINITY_DN1675_c0_g1~~TRINITY_DN1675_c0_g1_i11.p1  ORF type:complete len:430 (+),score=101.68 TRINITY_DN1675_c0_g1_i11:308-1597(+)